MSRITRPIRAWRMSLKMPKISSGEMMITAQPGGVPVANQLEIEISISVIVGIFASKSSKMSRNFGTTVTMMNVTMAVAILTTTAG